MTPHLELPAGPIPSRHRVLADFGPLYAANGFIGFVFAASGPLAIILSVGPGDELGLPRAAVLLLDDPGHGAGRPVPAAPFLPGSHRGVLRDGAPGPGAGSIGLGQAGDAGRADADR